MKKLLSLLVLSVLSASGLFANVSMPEIFSDNMVLQQNTSVKFWGWAKPFEKVIIKAGWMDEELSYETGNQGTWVITVKTPSAGGPFTVTVKGHNEITFRNVLVGEVWVCSGQSNMEWSALSGIPDAEQEISDANYPQIRLFQVYNSTAHFPQEHFTGQWDVCTPETMKSFSAVGYFFARKLHKDLGVPVGIINSSWGGTPAEAWMPEEAIMTDDFLREAAAKQQPVPWGPVENGRLYNSMIHPMIRYPIAGAIWYQGEANTVNAYAYTAILSGLITSWRERWGIEFPFYFAQIAPYKYGNNLGVEVMDAQRRALKVPGTGMIVLSDIGDTTDIHPKNKQDVGLRFGNMALRRHYKINTAEDSGPLFREFTVEKNKAVITFDHAEGLQARGKKLTHFEIAGEDKMFYAADAVIKDGKVIVSSKQVKSPVAVRFAWRSTATPNLFNAAGLPASPFITD